MRADPTSKANNLLERLLSCQEHLSQYKSSHASIFSSCCPTYNTPLKQSLTIKYASHQIQHPFPITSRRVLLLQQRLFKWTRSRLESLKQYVRLELLKNHLAESGASTCKHLITLPPKELFAKLAHLLPTLSWDMVAASFCPSFVNGDSVYSVFLRNFSPNHNLSPMAKEELTFLQTLCYESRIDWDEATDRFNTEFKTNRPKSFLFQNFVINFGVERSSKHFQRALSFLSSFPYSFNAALVVSGLALADKKALKDRRRRAERRRHRAKESRWTVVDDVVLMLCFGVYKSFDFEDVRFTRHQSLSQPLVSCLPLYSLASQHLPDKDKDQIVDRIFVLNKG
ncbi:hypothetical protein P9112_004583 [Eukaryota sp. TZLM1-RC]